MSYPKGNAQVGDTVWYRLKNGTWQFDWKVVEVGLPNGHGYDLDIQIGRGKARRVVSPHDSERIRIVPAVLDPMLAAFVAAYPKLVVVRYPTNDDRERFRLICIKCCDEVGLHRTEYLYGDATLGLRGGEACLGTDADNIVDASEQLRCGCKRRTYALPYEVD